MPNNGISVYFASYVTLNEKISLRAQHNQDGDTDTVTVCLFLAKYDVAFQERQTKVYRGFFASLRYIRQFTVR